MLGGSVALDLSRIVCSTKKSFIKNALSASSVWTMSSLQSGGIDVVLFGFMFSFILFRRNINYLLPRLLNFWKPDILP